MTTAWLNQEQVCLWSRPRLQRVPEIAAMEAITSFHLSSRKSSGPVAIRTWRSTLICFIGPSESRSDAKVSYPHVRKPFSFHRKMTLRNLNRDSQGLRAIIQVLPREWTAFLVKQTLVIVGMARFSCALTDRQLHLKRPHGYWERGTFKPMKTKSKWPKITQMWHLRTDAFLLSKVLWKRESSRLLLRLIVLKKLIFWKRKKNPPYQESNKWIKIRKSLLTKSTLRTSFRDKSCPNSRAK